MENRSRGEGRRGDLVSRSRWQAERQARANGGEGVGAVFDQEEPIRALHGCRPGLEIQNEELRHIEPEPSDLKKQLAEFYETVPCAYVELDARGGIIRINEVGRVLLQDTDRRRGTFYFHSFLMSDSQKRYAASLQEAVRKGGRVGVQLQLAGRREVPCWVWVQIQAEWGDAPGEYRYRLVLVDISSLKMTETDLQGSAGKYRRMHEGMSCGNVLLSLEKGGSPEKVLKVRIVEMNDSFVRITGIAADLALGAEPDRLFPQREEVWLRAVNRVATLGQPMEIEQADPESNRYLLISMFLLDADHVGALIFDISKIKRVEKELRGTCHELKAVIDEQTRELQQASTALRVLLKERDRERSDLEEKVVCNLNEFIRPKLASLSIGQLSARQRVLLESIGSSLDEITSPLSRKFILESCRLTPAETQVAEYIRQGKATKEISALMGVATSTIHYHRLNIRRRLGLTSKSMNLQSYLRSLV